MPEGCAPSGRGSLGDREGPVLELDLELALVARQHDIGGLVKQRPHPPIAAFGDAADIVDLARLLPLGDQAQIDADVSGSADARGIVDRNGTEFAIFSGRQRRKSPSSFAKRPGQQNGTSMSLRLRITGDIAQMAALSVDHAPTAIVGCPYTSRHDKARPPHILR